MFTPADAFARYISQDIVVSSQRRPSQAHAKHQISSSSFIVAYFGGLDRDHLDRTFVLDATEPTRAFAQLQLNPSRHYLAFFVEVADPV